MFQLTSEGGYQVVEDWACCVRLDQVDSDCVQSRAWVGKIKERERLELLSDRLSMILIIPSTIHYRL